MNTKQLFYALDCNPVTRSFFGGVFACDHLEDIIVRPQLIVCNTDPSGEEGEHWVVFFFEGTGVEFFDSLGNSFEKYRQAAKHFAVFAARYSDSVQMSGIKIQPPQTDICGELCLFYSYHRCKDESLSEILKKMSNIPDVLKFVRKEFIIPRKFNSKFVQCCKCLP